MMGYGKAWQAALWSELSLFRVFDEPKEQHMLASMLAGFV